MNSMSEKVERSWENLLNPAVLRPNLIVASIYIAAFELLKNAIVDRIRDFYTKGFDQNGLRLERALVLIQRRLQRPQISVTHDLAKMFLGHEQDRAAAQRKTIWPSHQWQTRRVRNLTPLCRLSIILVVTKGARPRVVARRERKLVRHGGGRHARGAAPPARAARRSILASHAARCSRRPRYRDRTSP